MMRNLNSILTNLKTDHRPPKVCTISKSTWDEYCPSEQAEDILSSTIAELEQAFGKLTITFDD